MGSRDGGGGRKRGHCHGAAPPLFKLLFTPAKVLPTKSLFLSEFTRPSVESDPGSLCMLRAFASCSTRRLALSASCTPHPLFFPPLPHAPGSLFNHTLWPPASRSLKTMSGQSSYAAGRSQSVAIAGASGASRAYPRLRELANSGAQEPSGGTSLRSCSKQTFKSPRSCARPVSLPLPRPL
jgi:hypothetical protein